MLENHIKLNIHLLKKGIVNSGNHKSDGVKDCSSHEFRPGAGCADVVYIMYIHVEKSPFLGWKIITFSITSEKKFWKQKKRKL